MSICYSGLDSKVEASSVVISIEKNHPLVQLAHAIPWQTIGEMILPDLKKTTKKGFLNLGRRLTLRIHLGAFLLQILYDLTDRETEYGIKDNAAYQLFCGLETVDHWHCPDHTKIEEFRNRLEAETKRQIVNSFASLAVNLGFADPKLTEIDSTVQEANASYPADSTLMTKLSKKSVTILEWLKTNGNQGLQKLKIDISTIMKKAKEYFFISKNTAIEKKRKIFSALHKEIKNQLYPFLDILENLDQKTVSQMPWNIKKIFDQVAPNARRYLLDVAHFIRTQSIKKGKLLAWQIKEFSCIKKGKIGKEKEFGRVFQIGRIKGNILFVGKSISIRMGDKSSLIPMVEEHGKIFGKRKIESLSTDRMYFSQANIDALEDIKDLCVGYQLEDMSLEKFGILKDHRAGLEALIGHAKQGGQLGKSRMKSDKSTLAAGYTAIGGLNLRQIIRHQKGKYK